MSVKLLTKHHLEFLSLNGGYTGSFESTLVEMPHCWKAHVMAQYVASTQNNCLDKTVLLSTQNLCND